MNENKKEILIIDDTADVIKVLIGLLNPNYKTYFAKTGEKGLKMAKEKNPDLILLDIIMPEIDGYEVCRRLKLDTATSQIPVIFVTAVSEAMDEAKGFEVGGVDYITKPFVPMVVQARIKNQLKLADSMKELERLYQLALDANPITGLPGNNSIKKRIESALNNDENSFVYYADLDNFKSYNDKYGFARGDEVISMTAKLFGKIAEDMGHPETFIGHIGGDDFALVVPKEIAEYYIKKYIDTFDSKIVEFYSDEDIQNGYIFTKNRNNITEQFPIMSISISGVDLTKKMYSKYLQINDICAEIKKKAKNTNGSCYIIDNREI